MGASLPARYIVDPNRHRIDPSRAVPNRPATVAQSAEDLGTSAVAVPSLPATVAPSAVDLGTSAVARVRKKTAVTTTTVATSTT